MRRGRYRIGITLHLSTILPASLLAILQFTPVIRRKLLILHRINGYIVILLLLLSHIGALMIARHAFGGTLETQCLVGVLAIMTTTGSLLAYYNIKRLQIEEHRAWMLRTWFYAGSIITLRLIMILAALIITKFEGGAGDGGGGYYRAASCDELAFTFADKSPNDVGAFERNYPHCLLQNTTTNDHIAIHATFSENVAQIASSLSISFGMAGWLALLLHAVGVEIYLRLTPREHERLRKVSYRRQLEAGMERPGSAGLTVERWGMRRSGWFLVM